MTPSYSAVILYFKRGPEVKQTLDALLGQSAKAIEIVVVDNASGDGVLDDIAPGYPEVRFLRLAANAGYSGGMNAGYRALRADSQYTVFLTHEVILDANCLKDIFSADLPSDFSMAGPGLRLVGSDENWSTGGTISVMGNVSHDTNAMHTRRVDWIDGSCMIVRRADLQKVGMFDEDYFLYWEDVDLSIRLGRMGGVFCVPSALARQDTGTAPIYYRERNRILLWRKQHAPVKLIGSVLSSLAKTLVKDLRKFDHNRASARFLGVFDGLTGRLTTGRITHLREEV